MPRCAAKSRRNHRNSPTPTNGSCRKPSTVALAVRVQIADVKLLPQKSRQDKSKILFHLLIRCPITGRSTARPDANQCLQSLSCTASHPRRDGGASGNAQAPTYAAARPTAAYSRNRPFPQPWLHLLRHRTMQSCHSQLTHAPARPKMSCWLTPQSLSTLH